MKNKKQGKNCPECGSYNVLWDADNQIAYCGECDWSETFDKEEKKKFDEIQADKRTEKLYSDALEAMKFYMKFYEGEKHIEKPPVCPHCGNYKSWAWIQGGAFACKGCGRIVKEINRKDYPHWELCNFVQDCIDVHGILPCSKCGKDTIVYNVAADNADNNKIMRVCLFCDHEEDVPERVDDTPKVTIPEKLYLELLANQGVPDFKIADALETVRMYANMCKVGLDAFNKAIYYLEYIIAELDKKEDK